MTKTFSPKIAEIDRQWFVVDAAGLPLGRVAAQVAHLLRGKHKTIYVPHMDTGDFVIVLNAEKTVLTGRKEDQKMYYRHSTRPGSLKETNARRLRQAHPERLVEFAVRGMLPKNRLGRQLYRKLRVYAGAEHPHESQKPTVYEVTGVRA